MTSYRRIVLGLAVAMPLAVAGSCAFAFTYSDGPPGYSSSDTFADPDSRFDAMSDQMNQMYGTDTTDYSDLLTNPSDSAADNGSSPAPHLPFAVGRPR